MTVAELKQYIYKENKIEYVLNEIGCGHIKYHQNKEYFSASNYNGDNKNAVNVKNNEYLNCKNYTRQKEFDEKSDLITLVQYNKQFSFVEAIKYLHNLFSIPLSYKKNITKKEKVDPLYIFKKVQSRRSIVNVLDFEQMDEDVINDFVPHIHIDWFREGIAPWTVNKFGLAYSYKYKRNVIPLRYWLDGSLLGFNMRTTVENYELFDIKKYFITPNYPKHLNLFGLWENKEAIQKARYVTIVESEKSVLKRDSLCDNTLVALSGHSISDEQVRILIGLNVGIVVSLDKDIDINEVRDICEKFYKIRPVYYTWDKYDLLEENDSPADASNKIYQYLMKYKVEYDEKEHREYLKSLKK